MPSGSGATITLPHLPALFWESPLSDRLSAWHGHVAFAHWLVCALAPKTVVELGTHNGVSFGALCNAVARTGCAGRCYAVDTWEGDEHAGFYDGSVYESLRAFNDQYYASFSKLMRMTFDQALLHHPDDSIDLLHIDGLHTYEAVAHDFRTWMPKLTDRAVVLFHDTAIRAHGFGVWKLWDELSALYPHFAFHHSAGLGVLAVGANAAPDVAALCAAQPSEAAELRIAFEAASMAAQWGPVRFARETEAARLQSAELAELRRFTTEVARLSAGLGAVG